MDCFICKKAIAEGEMVIGVIPLCEDEAAPVHTACFVDRYTPQYNVIGTPFKEGRYDNQKRGKESKS